MCVKDLLLLLMVTAVAVSLPLPVSRVTCSLGMGSPTRMVFNGQPLRLRQGETLILNCQGNPEGTPGQHFTLHDYPGTTNLIWKNESLLKYTWYVEATVDGPVRIYCFEGGVPELIFELTITVHNLDSLTEMPTPRPCTTPSPEEILPKENPENPDSVGLRETPMPSDTSTTNVGNGKTAATNAIERYALYSVTGTLIFVILAILVLCFMCIIKNYCRKGRRNKEQVELGHGRTIGGGDNVRENGQLPRSSDTNSNEEVHETSLDSSISGQNDHDTSTHHLTQS